jgi:tripartite-type tricarboxylate transporter receptor subunit TctC
MVLRTFPARTFLLPVFLGLAALVSIVTGASAQYPSKPVKVVVPASPGGGTDIQARYMASRLSERLGQQFVIENVAAAGGNVAAAQVAKASPDGYTLLMIAPAIVINHTLYARPGYDALTDFMQVAAWSQSPLLFIANPSAPMASLKELADYAKANPGKLAFGSGPGFINHMVMELFKIETGANILFVPYRGQAPALTDVVSGQIQLTVDSIASSGQFVEGGKVKALAVTGAVRAPAFPKVPTVAEAGFPKLTANTWYGLLAPANVPAEIVAKLATEIGAIQREPASVQRIREMGAEPFIGGASEFTDYYRNELAKWATVIKTSGLKID